MQEVASFLGPDYDVIVAGGSISGLAFAAEAAKKGIRVLVVEEHAEVGEPEKCDGLVSLRGFARYGYAPRRETIQSRIRAGLVHSPSGRTLEVSASGMEVVVLDRSAYDLQVAEMAVSNGAELLLGTRVGPAHETGTNVSVRAGGVELSARYLVDATGPASAPRGGILPAAKYELEADWVAEGTLEVYLDAEKYPGFFAWVIPCGGKVAKVGAAGWGINSFTALDRFLSPRPHKLLRKVPAPIYVGGPARDFVSGRKVLVGESAGQVKATTAGGIMTSVAGAVIAAKWLGDAILSDDPSLVEKYQPDWESRFLGEMKEMSRLRSIFEKLTNKDLDSILSALSTPRFVSKLSEADFDFHATALMGALGVGGVLKVAGVVASAEVRSLLAGA